MTTPTTVAVPEDEELEVVDDWGLPMDFHLFAQHELQRVYYGSGSSLQSFPILCVEALTPIDMVLLSNGLHDATGHCVWTGACLFVASLELLFGTYFRNKRILELGCGTGICGIALLRMASLHAEGESTTKRTFVTFTDSDPEALALCQRNCELNQLQQQQKECYAVESLTWGNSSCSRMSSFDTVLATDVLYDIEQLEPLLQTTRACLRGCGGTFVLAHVPRACFTAKNHSQCRDDGINLQSYIVQQAKELGFVVHRILFPNDLPQQPTPNDAFNQMSLSNMQDIGAVILIFQTKA